VSESSPGPDSNCPECGKPVDPLRAGAVSIIAGRIVHFCSATCREAHVRPEEEPEVEAHQPVVDAAEEIADESAPAVVSGVLPVAPMSPVGSRLPLLRPSAVLVDGVAILVLIGAGVAVALLRRSLLGGWLSPGIVTLAGLGMLAIDVIGARRFGLARIIEATAIPLAAFTLLSVCVFQDGARLPAMFAVALLLAERAGRLVELAGRTRSGIVEVLDGAPPLLLASEWRDNSGVAAKIRRVTLVLEWARFPLAALIGLGIWLLDGGAALALFGGATALVAINTRSLRMITGDAHLSVALSAARRGVVIRDAHAVERVGSARMILFMARRSLVLPEARVIDWQLVGDVDETAVLATLGGVEARAEGRIAEAVVELVSSRGVASRDVEKVEVRPGSGVVAQTPLGAMLCGSRGLMLEENVSSAEHEPWAQTVEGSGRRALFVALEGRVVAVFAVEEEPVTGAPEVARGLSTLGLEPAMITSAEVDAGQSLGARLEIENVRFETGEESLGALLPDVTSTGDTVLLVGHGSAFEQNLRSATAGFALGSDEPTMAGVDARRLGIDEVLRIVSATHSARRSVRLNLVSGLAVAAAGVALAVSWQSPVVAAVVCAFGCGVSALATFNGPYPLLERLGWRLRRLRDRVLRMVGLKRTAAP